MSDPQFNAYPLARGGFEDVISTSLMSSVFHGSKPKTFWRGISDIKAFLLCVRYASPIVANPNYEIFLIGRYFHHHIGSEGMFHHIVQSFLHNTTDVDLLGSIEKTNIFGVPDISTAARGFLIHRMA
jgi:hypothetical protein